MKKLLVILSVIAAFITASAFISTEKTTNVAGPGKSSCAVWDAPGYTATLEQRVVTPGSGGEIYAWVYLNQKNETGKMIDVTVDLWDFQGNYIESETVSFPGGWKRKGVKFSHKPEGGKAYYLSINNASCVE